MEINNREFSAIVIFMTCIYFCCADGTLSLNLLFIIVAFSTKRVLFGRRDCNDFDALHRLVYRLVLLS